MNRSASTIKNLLMWNKDIDTSLAVPKTFCKPYGGIVSKPFEMKEYRCQGLRRVKTDKQDAQVYDE